MLVPGQIEVLEIFIEIPFVNVEHARQVSLPHRNFKTYQFQSNSQLLILYLRPLLPTSNTARLMTFPSSCGSVNRRFPFKYNTSSLFNRGRSSVGKPASLFPLR